MHGPDGKQIRFNTDGSIIAESWRLREVLDLYEESRKHHPDALDLELNVTGYRLRDCLKAWLASKLVRLASWLMGATGNSNSRWLTKDSPQMAACK